MSTLRIALRAVIVAVALLSIAGGTAGDQCDVSLAASEVQTLGDAVSPGPSIVKDPLFIGWVCVCDEHAWRRPSPSPEFG
jgi:hypothetical protein